jgi:hypothetical protein
MAHWYDQLWARIGLRLAGLLLLISAWSEGRVLRHHVLFHPDHDMTVAEFLLGALLFCSASMGMALITAGGRLWKPVPLSSRWTVTAPRNGDHSAISA